MALSYYNVPGVREICHAVKRKDDAAIKAIAEYLIGTEVADEKSILIPAPQHYGYADYTKQICELIAETTGSVICDVLKCYPHESLYSQKLNGIKPSIHYYLSDKVPTGKLLFVDNVISTGLSYCKAKQIIGCDMQPFVFAIGQLPTV